MKKALCIVIVFFAMSWGRCFAADLSGADIAGKVYDRDDGHDAHFEIAMRLIDKKGNERERILSIYTKDFGALTHTYLVFQEPADIRGTSFLTIENEKGDDTQYLYLPELHRARRIVSSQKNLRFVNTDFTYEDMQRRKPSLDRHTLIGEERYDTFDCYVLESVPLDAKSQYSKRKVWVDKASFVIVKTQFYDKKGKLKKQFHVKGLTKKEGIPTPEQSVMKDIKENHTTIMKLINVTYNQGLEDEMFTIRQLEKN